MKCLNLLHTSMVFVKVETMMYDIMSEVIADVELTNIVDDTLLPEVMANGEVTRSVTQRICAYVIAAEIAGSDAILSLCSTVGPAIDVARNLVSIPVIKIDEAMAAKAVVDSDRPGVLATVPTTLKPTVALIDSKAREIDKTIEITSHLCVGAFESLMSGEKDQHDDLVYEGARKLAEDADLIVLAQASMTRLAPDIENQTGLQVLTSPRLGIEYTKQVLDSL